MTFTEVVVASVVLSLSARLGLQSWTATARAADRTATQTALTVQWISRCWPASGFLPLPLDPIFC